MELPPWLSSLSVPVLSLAVGGVIALLFLADYFRRKRAEVATISHLSTPPDPKPSAPASKHAPPKKGSQRSHLHHHSDKVTDCLSHPLLFPRFRTDTIWITVDWRSLFLSVDHIFRPVSNDFC
jgi:hypothetical protein